MKVGIIGLPATGKSTLFSLLTGAAPPAPGGRPEPRVGIARVPDPRVEALAEMYRPKKKTPATVEYVDMPGVAKGGGAALVDLPALRGVDALVHVVRAFESDVVPHPEGSIDPLRDVEISEDDRRKLRGYALLSEKPLLLVVNMGEGQVRQAAEALQRTGLAAFAAEGPARAVCAVSAPIEAEMAQLSAEDAQAFREDLGLREPGLDRVIRTSYDLLGLISFLTAGEDECRAWTIRRGTRAQAAAGEVHSDIERGFIRAEVVAFEDLMKAGSLAACREAATLRLEGKDYVVRDGDVINFRFNV